MSTDEMSDEINASGAEVQQEVVGVNSDSPDGPSTRDARSSPPLQISDDIEDEDLPVERKKRARDEMEEEFQRDFPSSATMVGDPASSAVPTNGSDRSNTIPPSTAAHTNMGPPLVPASSMTGSSYKTPPSAQPAPKSSSMAPPPTKTNPDQRERAPSPEAKGTSDVEEDIDVSQDPEDQIADFDWQDLEQRYHDKMKQLDDQEAETIEEFTRLCNYFAVWADAGSKREIDRSFKRLKTQATYVRHEEDDLEKKRQHYIKVVDAFKSALDLLRD